MSGGKDPSILTVSRPKLKVPTNFAAVTVFELMMLVVCKAVLRLKIVRTRLVTTSRMEQGMITWALSRSDVHVMK